MDIDQKLEILYELLVDNFKPLEFEIKELIADPARIRNTNKFASLLSDLKNTTFLPPLLKMISLAKAGDPWLTDFLYAAIDLMDELSTTDEIESPENLIDKLGLWILDYTGELSWYAAGLLKFYRSEKSEKIELQKLGKMKEQPDFFLVHVECLNGLLWYDKAKHFHLLKQFAEDETLDKNLRKFCQDNL